LYWQPLIPPSIIKLISKLIILKKAPGKPSQAGFLLLLAGNGFLFTLPGTGICPGPLTPEGKPLAVPQSPVAAYVHQPLDIQGDFGSEPPLNFIIAFYNLPQLIEFFLGQIVDKPGRVDLGFYTDLLRAGPAYPIDIGQGDIHMLIREVNPHKTRHKFSPSPASVYVWGSDKRYGQSRYV
jgi:hypothetical protein